MGIGVASQNAILVALPRRGSLPLRFQHHIFLPLLQHTDSDIIVVVVTVASGSVVASGSAWRPHYQPDSRPLAVT